MNNNNNDYEGSDVTHRSPLIGSPGGAGSGPTGLLCSGRDEMSAALLLDLGLVLIHADDLPLFDSLPAGHRALQTRDRETDRPDVSIHHAHERSYNPDDTRDNAHASFIMITV